MKTPVKIAAAALALTLVAGSVLAQPLPNAVASGESQPLALTPSQMEGPYYPVAKPADHDNDLTRVGSGTVAAGTILVLHGRVIDQRGRPVSAAVVELWQADRNGIYMHPNDSRTEQRDRAFQFFGQLTTDGTGNFEFRTIMPGFYGTRPRHLHIRVIRRDGKTLTTQLYFEGDERLAQDFLTRRLGNRLSAILLTATPRTSSELSAEKILVME
ncbi:protocatechuate 3,4-dioxygenase [Rhabdaerophilum sp. SD176]|uniref:dioxygenase family protein n=1 Tax=Rhabdaerophilum sp. SD176 TaxID=2983548 RepID=UPI0024E0300C|nr:protocatechuate 3,4-dioxygenase [Rhabdaerophilum sp. SD176]